MSNAQVHGVYEAGYSPRCSITVRTTPCQICVQSIFCDPNMLDESGCDRRNSTRRHAYSIRGICLIDHRILIRNSAIPVMSVQGIHDVFLAEGSINGERFEFFIRNYLLPVLMPFNRINPLLVVIMDNVSIHHVQSNVQLIESTGAKVIFLPPYSLDLNPLASFSH